MKKAIKKILKKLPIAFTRNQAYDRDTARIIQQVCRRWSNCIDVGCHEGDILNTMLKAAPEGHHFAFEPIPYLFEGIAERFKSFENIHLYELALSDVEGSAAFNLVESNPAYSGLKKRSYDRPQEIDREITVRTARLDDIIASEQQIDLIKIDVEGGELQVMQGGFETIKRCKPVILFEHGLGGSDHYGTTPAQVFQLLQEAGLQVSLLHRYLKKEPALSLQDFEEQFYRRLNFFFIAYPLAGQ